MSREGVPDDIGGVCIIYYRTITVGKCAAHYSFRWDDVVNIAASGAGIENTWRAIREWQNGVTD